MHFISFMRIFQSALFFTILISLSGCRFFQKKRPFDDYVFADSTATAPEYDYSGETWKGDGEILYSDYKAAAPIIWQLENTILDLSFDFEARRVDGEAALTIHPHWDSLSEVILDAKYLQVHEVWLNYNTTTDKKFYKTIDSFAVRVPYSITADSQKLKIDLPHFVKRDQKIQIRITYSASPYNQAKSGNAAITDDKGIYFINHNLKDPTKPRQIWTQGETESSSRWFPTFDAPNQKTTLDISLRVPDTMVSLSNGTLISSKPSEAKGFRTDRWVQKQPHAPYLTMIALGNWSVVNEFWKGKQVNYLVEKEYQPFAKLIFGNTPAMIEFFSSYLGVDYPWDKYSQVVVRDFVSGAMENTTATVHMEELQHTAREHADETYEDYISHELFHQWFGDLVTTESWSNITLNESFATYGEYLWREHFYGKDNAESLLEDLRYQYRYYGDGENNKLVRYNWKHDGELFDNVSYQKGACILHMLRYTVGEEAFRESLKRYLTKHRFGAAEVDHLRLCFEEVTGKDLHWFFNQWYFTEGHPDLQISLETDKSSGYFVRIEQTQYHRNTYAFRTKIKFKTGDSIKEKEFFVSNRIQNLYLGSESEPEWYIFDSDNILLCDLGIQNPGFLTAEKELKRLNATWPNASTGSQLQLLKLAEKLMESGFVETELELLKKPLNEMYLSAINSKTDMLISKGLDLRYYLNEKAGGSEPDALLMKIAGNARLKPETRKQAINEMYYAGLSDQTLISLSHDPSLQIAAHSIILMHEPNVWVPYALKEGLSDTAGVLAATWARKIISHRSAEPLEVLETLASNPRVGLKDYRPALSSVFYYIPESDQSTLMSNLAASLKKNNQKGKLSLLLYILENEIEQINLEIGQIDDNDPGLLLDLNTRKADFSNIIATFS